MLAYLDCFSGVSGDKFLGSLLDAGLSVDALREQLAALPLTGWDLSAEEVSRAGLRATLVTVDFDLEQPSRTYADIEDMLSASTLSDAVRDRASQAFRLIAEAEARVHGVEIADVHFHEVGAVDSIVDIVGAAAGLDALGVTEVWASPVCVGYGTVGTRHGTLPVPTPATAELLRDAPTFGGLIEGEMTTPTGAALLRTFVSRYAPAPPAEVLSVGYGAGTRDPFVPNVLRCSLSERGTWDGLDEPVTLLTSVIDHLAPEHLAPALDLVRDSGALDVWQSPILAKKGRLAVEVTVMARPEDAPRLTEELMRQTGTLGVRRADTWRSVAERHTAWIRSDEGDVRAKAGGVRGAESVRPEADEVARIARQTGEAIAVIVERLSRDAASGDSHSATE